MDKEIKEDTTKYANFRGARKIEVLEIHVNEGMGTMDDPLYREVYFVTQDGRIIGQGTSRPLRTFAGDGDF